MEKNNNPNMLKQYRLKKKWSQVGLAFRSGVGVRTIIYMEKNNRVPNLRTAIKLAKAFGVKAVDELEVLFLSGCEDSSK